MKKVLFLVALAMTIIFLSCSDDDGDSKCESCTSDVGNKFEICDNGDGTYAATGPGGTETLDKGELEGFTPKEFIRLVCAFDEEEEL